MSVPAWSRRRLLATALAGAAALPFARASRAASLGGATSSDFWIELVNLHTNEVVTAAYRNAQGYLAAAVRRFDRLLRDHRTGEQHEIDRALFDHLIVLARAAGREPRYEIISGYRSPATNAKLRSRSSGVARHSLHMEGRALDVRLKGCSCSVLRDLAIEARGGGVGYYARSNFVHIDTGRVRFWQG